jgi:hypothetical protein
MIAQGLELRRSQSVDWRKCVGCCSATTTKGRASWQTPGQVMVSSKPAVTNGSSRLRGQGTFPPDLRVGKRSSHSRKGKRIIMEGDKAAGRSGFRPVHPGRIIKRNIDALGLTIEAFADHIGTSRQTVHAIHHRWANRGEGGDRRAPSAGVQNDAAVLAQSAVEPRGLGTRAFASLRSHSPAQKTRRTTPTRESPILGRRRAG